MAFATETPTRTDITLLEQEQLLPYTLKFAEYVFPITTCQNNYSRHANTHRRFSSKSSAESDTQSNAKIDRLSGS